VKGCQVKMGGQKVGLKHFWGEYLLAPGQNTDEQPLASLQGGGVGHGSLASRAIPYLSSIY